MTMPPLPIALVFLALVGWPILKVCAAVAIRRKRMAIERLKSTLMANPRYGDSDHRAIEAACRDARGDPMAVLTPVLVLFGIPIFSIAHLLGFADDEINIRTQASLEASIRKQTILSQHILHDMPLVSPVYSDESFWEMDALAFDVGLFRYPTATIISVVFTILMLPLLLMAFGIRSSLKRLLSTSIRSSVTSARSFSASMSLR